MLPPNVRKYFKKGDYGSEEPIGYKNAKGIFYENGHPKKTTMKDVEESIKKNLRKWRFSIKENSLAYYTKN